MVNYCLIILAIFQKTDEPGSLEEVIKSLKRFIEHSTLGDFHTRLDMLLGFHCHVVTMTTCQTQSVTIATDSEDPVTTETRTKRTELEHVLWNIHQFYSRFSDTVQCELERLRSPVEKELKVSFMHLFQIIIRILYEQ